MKLPYRLPTLIFMFFTPFLGTAQSQTNPNYAFYMGGKIGMSNGVGLVGEMGFRYFPNRKTVLAIQHQGFTYPALNQPDDYHAGLCLFGDCEPRDRTRSLAILYGVSHTNPSGRTRFSASAGPAWVTQRTTTFATQARHELFDENYDTDREFRHTYGLLIDSRVEFNLGRHIGLYVGLNGNINPAHSYGAAGVGFTFGQLR